MRRELRLIPLALAVLSAGGCHEKVAPTSTAVAVKVGLVERASGASARRYSAQIEPASRVDLAFKVGGYVDSIAQLAGVDGHPRVLQEGDPVRRGTELARLRVTDYSQRVAEAAAAVDQATAGAAQAKLDWDRISKIANSGSVTLAEIDGARIRNEAATAVLAGAGARRAQAQTAAGDTSLRSPIDGVVLKRTIEVGSLAGPGTVAFSVADVRSVKVVFGVPDTILSKVKVGAAQSVMTEAYPNVQFDGRITRVAPSADPHSRVFEVEVTIPNDDQRLKSGMVAALKLDQQVEEAPTAALPLVPLSSVVRPPGRAEGFAVFVVEEVGGKLVGRAKDVELGEYVGRVIPVKKGLSGGERVVVQGAGLLSDGESIEVIQ
jgi:RND family efflux transporter MFP subunit